MNTSGALASNRNTFSPPRRAMNWRIASGCCSMLVRGIRDIRPSLSAPADFGREGEGPLEGHEGLLDVRSVRGDTGLVPDEIRLQRVLRGEHRIAVDVRVVSQEQLGD